MLVHTKATDPRERRKALARESLTASKSWDALLQAFEAIAATTGLKVFEGLGDLEKLKELWFDGVTGAWADLFTEEMISELLTWQASPTAIVMLEKQSTLQTMGEAIMQKAIEVNTRDPEAT